MLEALKKIDYTEKADTLKKVIEDNFKTKSGIELAKKVLLTKYEN